MNFFNFFSNNKNKSETIKKKYLVKFLTISELFELGKIYINPAGVKFIYEDANGLRKQREPTRKELEEAIIDKLNLDNIVRSMPHLQEKLDKLEENEVQE